jgi:superfamily II DNA or RNA helicase
MYQDILASRVRSQKGLLAIHGLGSGKTKTGISFAQNFPKYEVVVFVPKGLLDYVWKKEMEDLGVVSISKTKRGIFSMFSEKSFEKYKFVDYDNVINFILSDGVENKIVLADEAHKLAIILKELIKTDINKVAII